jgi:transcriptional regulator with XRE-family HTH domain
MDDLRIGARLRQQRMERKLSLRALARASGIALSHLSALEHGKNSVTVANLKRLLDALGTNLSDFFAQEPPPRTQIVWRRQELTEISGQGRGLSFRDVAAGRPGRALQLIWETYAPGADTGPGSYRHEAEEAGLVIKGKLELTVGDQQFILGPGDAYYFDSRLPHRVRNVGKGPAQAVSVNTPPSF